MKKTIEHTCHYCKQERKLEVVEKYPCGARLVIDSMVGVCCLCGVRSVLWGSIPVICGKDEAPRTYKRVGDERMSDPPPQSKDPGMAA